MGVDVGEKLICKSLDLDGVNDYISNGVYPNPFSGNEIFNFEINNQFSISVWFKIDTLPFTIYTIISKYDPSTDRGYGIEINGSGIVSFFIIDGGKRMVVKSSQQIIPDVWYNVIVTYNGSGSYLGQNIYINSINDTVVKTAGVPTTIQVPNAPLEICRLNFLGGSRYVDGLIANVRIWNTELTQTNVNTEYNNGFGRLKPILPNNCKLDLNMSKSVWDGSKFLVKNNTNLTSDFESINMSESSLINECYQI